MNGVPIEAEAAVAPSRGGRRVRLVTLIVVPLILLIVAALLAGEFSRGAQLRQIVNRSYDTRLSVQRILSLHQDMETGQRGFVVTGRADFLDPYHAARAQVDRALAELRERTVVPREVDILRQHSVEQRRFAAKTILLRQTGRQAEAQAAITAGTGKRIMDAIRLHIGSMQVAEQRALEERISRAEAAQTRTRYFTFGLLALLVVALAIASVSNQRIERARVRAMARAEEQSARLEAIFTSAKDGVLTLNESGSIETVNPAAAYMYGYLPAELIRRDVGILFEVAPDAGAVETFLQRLRRGGSDASYIQEFAGKRKDGSTFPTEVAISPVYLPDCVRFVAIVRDATERKQVEQMKSEFVSTVSHELRTPLTSIAGSLGLLAGGAAGELPERALRLISIAHGNSQRLVRLINDILDIEKIESGKMRFDISRIELLPLVEQAIQEQRGSAVQRDITILHGHIDPAARIYADLDRMLQVLTNLLSNAIKFSRNGSEVRIDVVPLDRRYRITVSDRGEGIPEEFRSRMFEKFAQADSTDARQKGGTGLGLSIVKEIVTRLGGSISFESEEGRGTAFHVDVPSADVPAGEKLDDEAASGEGHPLLLHVEDDPDMLRLVASAFEGHAQVFSTPSVVEAEASIERHDYDAIILDIGMADGSGLELIPLLRRRQPRVPIILFTAQEPGPDVAASVDAVLIKSRSSLDRLVETVDGLLHESRAA